MTLMSFWLVLALFLDQLSKKIIVELVSPGRTISVLGEFIMITNVGNTGISFGMFQGYTHILIPLVFVIIAMVFLVSLKFVKESPWLAFAFGSIIGGALGNQIDRLFKGAVVDFIYVNSFAVFNVSDSFVVIGAFILGVHTIFFSEKKNDHLINGQRDLKIKIMNHVNSGVYDSGIRRDLLVKEFIHWLFKNSNTEIVLMRGENEKEKEMIHTFLKATINDYFSPLILIKDLSENNDDISLDSPRSSYDVYYLSTIKKTFSNQCVFENERQFFNESIYHCNLKRMSNDLTSEVLSKKRNKRSKRLKTPLLKLTILERKSNRIKESKNKESEGRPEMTKNDFILEIITEEIPPTEIELLCEQFEKGFSEFLQNLRIKYDQMMFFYSSRRFGIHVQNMALKQQDLEEVKRGPAKSIAYDTQGAPTKALAGFLRGNNATENDLIFKEENSEIYCYIKRSVKGLDTKDVLEKQLISFLGSLSFKKPMRWAQGDYKFVRPIHNIVAILADQLIDIEFMGIKSSKTTLAHRFKESLVELDLADQYFDLMKENDVYADQRMRKQKIINAISCVEKENGINIPADNQLIEEVTAITEFPNPVFGTYDSKFLQLPKEVLITTLKHHQRTFPVLKDGEILPHFLSFQDNDQHSVINVKSGYKKVIEARLEDALFLYLEDLKVPFEKKTEELKEIGFQNKLGSLYDKIIRVNNLSVQVCRLLEIEGESVELVKSVVYLMKNDLTTQMVYEFPELQGVMGRIYAKIAGEPQEVYQAIEEQYTEGIPETFSGCIASLADNLDTIAGNLLINHIPSGSKDPFGLRRALQKCLHILVSREWDIDLQELFDVAIKQYRFEIDNKQLETIKNIFFDLLKNRIDYYLSEKEIPYDVINATAHIANNPMRCVISANALKDLKKNGDITDLMRIFERVHNISKNHLSTYYDSRLFEHQEEIILEEHYNDIRDEIYSALDRLDYQTALEKIKHLKTDIDNYFENVFVMSEREDLKLTRLGFLKNLDDFLLRLGNFSEIVQNRESDYE